MHLPPQGRGWGVTLLSLGLFAAVCGGCSGSEFDVPISFVVPTGHNSFDDLSYLSAKARYGDGRSYDFFLDAPSSGSQWDIPMMPAGAEVTMTFEGLVPDGLGGDGQVVVASGVAGPLAFDPENPGSARVLFTRRGRTGSLPGGSHPALEPQVVELPDGRLLSLGGASGFGGGDPLALENASVFEVNGTDQAWQFAPVEPMRGPRMDFAAVLVEGSDTEFDGKVVVVGSLPLVEGRSGRIVVDEEAETLEEARDLGIPEVFDPSTGTWEDFEEDPVMRLNAARGHHALVQVGSELYVFGGITLDEGGGLQATTETLRIPLDGGETELLSAMGDPRWRHTATRVGADRVVVVGGAAIPSVGADIPEVPLVERYDASENEWVALGDLEPARADHVAVALPDGRVLVAAGVAETDSLALAETWFIDPGATGQDEEPFTRGPDLLSPRARADARLLPGGRVIVCGGEDSDGQGVVGCEIWTPGGEDALGGWAPASDPGTLYTPRVGSKLALLDSGDVIVVGGQSDDGSLVNDLLVHTP